MIYYKHLVNRLQLSNDGSIPIELMNSKLSNITMNRSVYICMDESCRYDNVMSKDTWKFVRYFTFFSLECSGYHHMMIVYFRYIIIDWFHAIYTD